MLFLMLYKANLDCFGMVSFNFWGFSLGKNLTFFSPLFDIQIMKLSPVSISFGYFAGIVKCENF